MGTGRSPNFRNINMYNRSKQSKLNVLIAHDNRTKGHTSRAHKLIEDLKDNPNLNVLSDKDAWKRGEKTSPFETNRREKDLVNKADLVVRLVPAPSQTKQSRHEGAKREVNKTIRANKPLLEIFEFGGRNSPKRSITQLNYKKRAEIHIKKGQNLKNSFYEGMQLLQKKTTLTIQVTNS